MVRILTIVIVLMAAAAQAEPPGEACSSGRYAQVECIREQYFAFDTCQAIAHFARAQGLDVGFFARLIWQESRFDPFALSPVGAQGIAQFMPQTARQRGLKDAFNPALALEHSAAYLAEMVARYGNPGLAAAGYNGGERRAEGIIAGTDGLAQETVDYVAIITGLSWQDWLEDGVESPDMRLSKTEPFREACYKLARGRKLSPMPRPEPRRKPWGVQLAFGTTKQRALKDFDAKTRDCAKGVKGERPDLLFRKSRASPRGGYWMARLGRTDRKAAEALCSRLRRAGCLCRVYRN